MKKLISVLLVAVTCLSVLASCAKNEVDTVGAMYKNSQPTKVVATTTQTFGERKLESRFTLTVGRIDGKEAAIYEGTEDKMRDIESGAHEDIVGPIETVVTKLWYHEPRGVCDATKIPYKWDKNVESFIPEKGAVALNINSGSIKEYVYEGKTLTFTVAKAKSAEVFGEALDSDATVTIINDGAVVTYVKITYTTPADTANSIPEQIVVIEVDYTYDLESITFQ